MPSSWRQRLLEAHSLWDVADDLGNMLSKHWYQGAWRSTPIRGDREPVYQRFHMYERARYLGQLARRRVTLTQPAQRQLGEGLFPLDACGGAGKNARPERAMRARGG